MFRSVFLLFFIDFRNQFSAFFSFIDNLCDLSSHPCERKKSKKYTYLVKSGVIWEYDDIQHRDEQQYKSDQYRISYFRIFYNNRCRHPSYRSGYTRKKQQIHEKTFIILYRFQKIIPVLKWGKIIECNPLRINPYAQSNDKPSNSKANDNA